ncbi:MAG: hypothetical protein ACYSR0_10305 [Planctomycetota bacterium]|jgi:hypothetical protein
MLIAESKKPIKQKIFKARDLVTSFVKKGVMMMKDSVVGRERREWHPDFIEYMKFIVSHPNYHGMPELYKDDGNIRWIVTGNSKIGKERLEWWKGKAQELGIPIMGKWISATAKMNHPTKMKVCQICGQERNIKYMYPNKNLIKKLNNVPGFEGEFDYYEFKTIEEIVHDIIITLEDEGFTVLQNIFNIPDVIEKTKKPWSYEQCTRQARWFSYI